VKKNNDFGTNVMKEMFLNSVCSQDTKVDASLEYMMLLFKTMREQNCFATANVIGIEMCGQVFSVVYVINPSTMAYCCCRVSYG
jgi:hypothetical protein